MMLDTSVCVDLLREQATGLPGPATRKLVTLGDTTIRLSLFTLCELESGAAASANPRRERERIRLLAAHRSIAIPDERFARLFGEARAALRTAGTPVPVMDFLIGVSALQAGEPLLTRDPEHFKKIPGLVVDTY
jgi:predicted nucleic acid-binding protein